MVDATNPFANMPEWKRKPGESEQQYGIHSFTQMDQGGLSRPFVMDYIKKNGFINVPADSPFARAFLRSLPPNMKAYRLGLDPSGKGSGWIMFRQDEPQGVPVA